MHRPVHPGPWLQAAWATEGLQTDQLSIENGAIVCNAARCPLLIDPQLQGVAWIKRREAPRGLVTVQTTEPRWLDKALRCIEEGLPLLVENMGEVLDASLESMVARRLVRRGRALLLRVGSQEVAFNPAFRLYLATKLANPHYPPEVAAQTTVINFCITPHGLEQQLLAMVCHGTSTCSDTSVLTAFCAVCCIRVHGAACIQCLLCCSVLPC